MLESDLELAIPGGVLSATLACPVGAGPWPVVLLIAGSGPTDRDGNNPLLDVPCDNLKRLAHALAARGIASLRYDKRGVGRSRYPGLSEEALSFDALVDDAVALSHRLRRDRRLDGLVLFGHSEGALIASLAAQRADAMAVVCVAGAGERASALIRRQLAGHVPQALEPAAMSALAALEQGNLAHDVPDDLVLLFRPSVQPYLVSWFRHDPAEVLANLPVPVMLVHGSDDAQVSVAHAHLLHTAQPQARLRVVEGMDHLLAIGGDAQAGIEVVARELQAWLRELPQFSAA